MKETFKPVQGYENLYEVSNYGRIKSLPRMRTWGNRSYLTKEKFLSQRLHDGYLRVNLCDVGIKMKTVNVHILVINAFHEKVEGLDFANHKDLNRLNNYADNLEWVNRRENTSHAVGLKGTECKYRYVCRADNKTNPFQARLKIDGKMKYLGCYKTAKQAYDVALEYMSKNGILNCYI